MDKLGSFFGIVGAILVAINIPESKYGFVILLFSAIFWIIESIKEKLPPLLWMNIVFFMTDMIGIYRWIL